MLHGEKGGWATKVGVASLDRGKALLSIIPSLG